MEEYKIPNIHFIFPAGAKKGSFQAGFIYQLKKHYNNLFRIYQIDGTSIGALNGLDLLLSKPDIIKKNWFEVNNINDIAPLHSNKIPIGKDIFCYIKSFKSLGVSQNIKLKEKIDYVLNNNNLDDLNKFNCTVSDINNGENYYINGTDNNIGDYVLASASAWVIFPPVKIKDSYFADGALNEFYPIKNLKDSKADLKVIVGLPFINKKGLIGDNNLLYLTRLISISAYKKNNNDYNKINQMKDNKELIVIKNLSLQEDNLDEDSSFKFNSYEIQENFILGMKECNNFAKLYLPLNDIINNETNIEIDKFFDDNKSKKKLSIINRISKYKRNETKNRLKSKLYPFQPAGKKFF